MKKVSLNELMGKSGTKKKKLSLDDLGDLLGERMPKLEYSPVGRIRLITAMRNRFGDSWRNLEGISDVMSDFDKEAKFAVKLQELKMIRGKNGKSK